MKNTFVAAILLLSLSIAATAQQIIPTPHSITVTEGSTAYRPEKVQVHIDKRLLSQYPDGYYTLTITPKKTSITAGNERGIFYAKKSLAQLVTDGKLPLLKIVDYPDIPFRGTVEGFYGKPWSHRDRLAQLKFYGDYKLNTYIYGPKDDPYHSSPNWRLPYPEKEATQISELVKVSKENFVDFVWAIHPGVDIKWNEEDFQHLLHKCQLMYDLGVRSFAVFFDDITGEGTRSEKQAELLNRLNKEFIMAKGDITPLIMCPTEYNKGAAGEHTIKYLATLGNELDPSIQIMWTGDAVCADITDETLEWINGYIQRPSYIWWNFPVSDYVHNLMLQGPSYGLTRQGKEKMNGFVSNPMEHAEASKLALIGVADYTWNVAAYDYLPIWEAALKRLMPNASAAYRTFAIHSADMGQNGHGYRRDESWEPIADMYAEYQKMSEAPAAMLNSNADPYLLEELKPWLTQFALLGKRGMQVIELKRLLATHKDGALWRAYLAGEMTPEETKAFEKHKSGTKVMAPYIDQTRARVGKAFYESLSGEPLHVTTPITNFAHTATLPEMLDKNSDTYYYSWGMQAPGKWVGVDLGEIVEVTNIVVEQGRKEGDNDYFQRAVLECSTDSLQWTALTDTLCDVYTIHYNARPVNARYLRLRALEGSSSTNWTGIRRFDVNPQQSQPILYTNLPQMAKAGLVLTENTAAIKPLFEAVRVEKGSYFGIELPMICDIESVTTELKGIEYSLDGITWSTKKADKARYIRYYADKPGELKLKKFEVRTHENPDQGVTKAFDKDLTTSYRLQLPLTLNIPPNTTAITVLSLPGNEVFVIDEKGNRLSSSSEGFISVALPANSRSVTLLGKTDVREIIYKK